MTSPAADTDADTTLGADTTMDSVNGGGDTETYPDGYPGFGPEVLPAELTYHTRDEAYKAINVAAAQHGYAFITSRSFQTSSGLTTALYMCDRGGRAADPNRVLKRQRAASRRIGCNFSVYVKERRDGTWQLKHRMGPQFSQHNHAPSTDIYAHRVHRALDADQKDSIDVLLQMDMKLKQIVTFLRLKYRKQINARDVSNYIASARRQRGLQGEGAAEADTSQVHEHQEEPSGQLLGPTLAPAPRTPAGRATAGRASTGAGSAPGSGARFVPTPGSMPPPHAVAGRPGPPGPGPGPQGPPPPGPGPGHQGHPGQGAPALQHQQRLPAAPPHNGVPQGRPRQYAHGHGPSADQEKEDLLLEEELREQLGKELSQSASHDYFAPN